MTSLALAKPDFLPVKLAMKAIRKKPHWRSMLRKVRYFSTPPILSRLGASSSGTCLHRYNHLPQDQSTLFPVINPHLDNIHLPMAGI